MLVRFYIGTHMYMIGVKPWEWEIMTELTNDFPYRAMLGIEFEWGRWDA